MKYTDLHVHSTFSSDGHSTIIEHCERALALGLRGVAFTEHYDAMTSNPWGPRAMDGRAFYTEHSATARQAVMEAQERYSGRLDVIYAIELGQPYEDPQRSCEFLDAHDFDFVLGSIHNVEDGTDYYYVDYDKVDIDRLFDTYYRNHLRLIEFGRIDSIGHLDYPVRVLEKYLPKPATMLAYRDVAVEVARAAAQAGIPLEINTRGLFRWFDRLTPEDWVLKAYREFGGEAVTLGSDGHTADAMGLGLDVAAARAEQFGLRVITGFKNHIPSFD